MLSHDGVVYQILFSVLSVEVRRAIWSGKRLISKPPTSSLIPVLPSCGPYQPYTTTTTPSTDTSLRSPSAVNAVTDLASGLTVLLIADLVTNEQNETFVAVYKLQTSTKTISLVVELPLPVPASTQVHLELTHGPTVSCVCQGQIYLYSCTPMSDNRKTEWQSKDVDLGVAQSTKMMVAASGTDDDDSGKREQQWRRTTYHPQSTGGRFAPVPCTGAGPLLFQEFNTTQVVEILVVQAETSRNGGEGEKSRLVLQVSTLLQAWCHCNDTMDAVAYGVDPPIVCLASTTIQHDSKKFWKMTFCFSTPIHKVN